jgi:hypothetical protein
MLGRDGSVAAGSRKTGQVAALKGIVVGGNAVSNTFWISIG